MNFRTLTFSCLLSIALATGCLGSDLPQGLEVSASATLRGRVVDDKGLPVSGATVVLDEANRSAVTGRDGTFRFAALPAGLVTVSVVAKDYFASDPRQVQLVAGGEVELVVELQPRPIVQETIVVTGTGTEYLASEAPVPTALVTTDVVDSQVKTTLAEALQATVPGLRVEMNCQNCGFMQLRVNGLPGPYAQILEDGLPSYSGVAAVYGLEQIPAAFIEQIEVVRGGNSALYGPGAVAGVVNLIRREPRANRFRIDTLGGWHRGRPEQQAGGSAQLVELPGDFSADVYYRWINRTHIDRDRDGFSDLGKRRLHSGGGTLYRQFLEGRGRLAVNGTIADEFRRGGSQLDQPPHRTWITEMAAVRRSTGSFRWNHTPTPATFYSLKTSIAHLYRDTYYGSGYDPNAYGWTRNPLWVSDAQVGHQVGHHTLLSGYQFWRDSVDDVAPAYNRRYGGVFTDHGLYFQDELRFSPRLILLGGFRADKSNQIRNWIFSPRAGLKLGLTDNLNWRVAVSTGFRAPAVFDEDLHITQVGGGGFLIQNHPDLKEEKSVSFSTCLNYFGRLAEKKYRLAVNFFWTDLNGNHTLVEREVPGADYRQLLRINGPGAYVRGFDISGDIELSPTFRLRGAVTFQTSRFDQPEEQFGAWHFLRTPDRYGFLGFDWSLPGSVSFLMTSDFTGSMLVPHYAGYIPQDRLDTSKPFAVFNAVLSKTFEVTDRSKMRLFLTAGNITDAYQPDLDMGPYRDAGYVYGPTAMRQLSLGTTWEF